MEQEGWEKRLMSYESEQIELKKELEETNARLDALEKYFEQNPQEKFRYSSGKVPSNYSETILSRSHLDKYKRMQYEQILQYKYYDYDTSNWSTLYLEYKILKNKKEELLCKLSESKTQRNISKTVNYIGSITPQHVSGRVYKVENGDGCATFCLWFFIIDALLVLLYCIISGG